MKPLTALTIALMLAGWPAVAQNNWDISKIDVSKLPPAADKEGVTFDKDIRPILASSCLRCHGKDKPKGGLRMDSLENVLKGGNEGKMIIPGDSKKSLLVTAAARIDDNIAMPPKRRPRGGGGPGGPPGPDGGTPPSQPPGQPPGPGAGTGGPNGGPPGGGRGVPPKPLTAEQVGLIRAWVDQGAK